MRNHTKDHDDTDTIFDPIDLPDDGPFDLGVRG